MSFPLLPDLQIERLYELKPAMLSARGITLLMLDFDNTIIPYTTDTPTAEMEQWLCDMLQSEIQICVVSNSKRNRVVNFCRSRNIPVITHAKKPFAKGIRRCLEQFGAEPQQAALAGDQIYTDVFGINCAGGTSILVRPIHLHNIWLRLRHVAELPFIAIGKRSV